MNHDIRGVILLLLVVGVTILLLPFITFYQKNRLKECITTSASVPVSKMLLSSECNNYESKHLRRRHLTTDEMLYVLYGQGEELSVHSEQLLHYIRSHIVRSAPVRPRVLQSSRNKTDVSQLGQSTYVDKLLSHRRNGFFIECGAANGDFISNSLFFERERDWTGILIEPNPEYFAQILKKNRRAYVLNACLSSKRKPMTDNLVPAGVIGGVVGQMTPTRLRAIKASKRLQIPVQCFPLNSVMASINVSHVDYLSLDVEGPEMEILRTIDWTRLQIDVITVEYRIYGANGVNTMATLKKLSDLRQFFRETDLYREVGIIPHGDDTGGLDAVFARIK